MFRKLVDNPVVPIAPSSTLGVGAVVIKDNRLLVVKDKIWKRFKLPGGYINATENISQAIKREVFEETGISIQLESIVSLAHSPASENKDSNIYIVCRATAFSEQINIIDCNEIIEAKWMDLDDYFNCNDIHLFNKNIVKTALQSKGLKRDTTQYFGKQTGNREYYLNK